MIRVLGRDSRQKISLVDLLTDPESRDQILDDESLYRAILENRGNLTISPQFYFYALARLVLRRVGIEDRTLSDYVAALLEKFSSTRRDARANGRRADYLFVGSTLSIEWRFFVSSVSYRTHLGNLPFEPAFFTKTSNHADTGERLVVRFTRSWERPVSMRRLPMAWPKSSSSVPFSRP